jgi:hypothetical protein
MMVLERSGDGWGSMARRPDIAELRKPFVGRWRIVGADLWDREYLNLVTEAHLTVSPTGSGEIELGAQTLGLDISVSPGMLAFDFHGSDEGDEVWGEGFMELTTENAAEIELDYKYGDSAVLKAVRAGKS